MQHRKYSFITVDYVGITHPVVLCDPTSSDSTQKLQWIQNNIQFPLCRGHQSDRTLERVDAMSAKTCCSSTVHNGWRILRFYARVGNGKKCYKRLRDAVFDWDFESDGRKKMGILAVTSKQYARSPKDLNVALHAKTQHSALIGHTSPRRRLLATFTELWFPKPLKSLFVINPVYVAYEIKDARQIPKCLFSSTSYATISGHLLAGEERVTVIWRKDIGGDVDVEIVSFSRSSPSIGGKIVWPLIGRIQKRFFLEQMNYFHEVAKAS